jgi:DNA polymerase-3 subunit epsilon
MKELEAVEHLVCETLLEAEVTEIRLIHTHRPRYNRRSRPPKSSHFVKVTKERFPRLSVVRTFKGDALAYLGPFRSKRAADLVATAIWDALPIRRCRTRPGTRSGKCAPAQLGVARCPCDGTMSEQEYRPVVDRLVNAIESDPGLLLDPLVERMTRLSNELRYEEAGWVRDRHNALARALERRQRWQALQRAGLLEIEGRDGRVVVIDHGLFVGSRIEGSLPTEPAVRPEAPAEVPGDVAQAEEADLVWRWINDSQARLVGSSGFLAFPSRRARKLTVGSRAAA